MEINKLTCRGSEIKIIKGDLQDATQPNVSKNKDAQGELGRYYRISTMAVMTMVDGVMTRPGKSSTWNVFENGNRKDLFNDITQKLSDPKNYTLLTNGDIVLDRLTLGISGILLTEECGFHYTIIDPKTGKASIDNSTGLPRLLHTVKVYVTKDELDTGEAETIIAAAVRRAKKNEVTTEEEKEAASATEQAA